MKLTTSISSAASRAACLAATLCAAVCLSSCFHVADSALTEEAPTKQFTFHVNGDFATSYEDFTKAASRLEASNAARLADLWVLDYDSNGTLLQMVHQDSTQTGFGSVPMSLTYGQHTIVFVASKGEDPTITATVGSTSGSLSWAKVKDTFTLSYPIDVTAASNGNRAPELQRAISGLKIVISDVVPTDAKYMTVTLGSRSQSLTLPALSALPYTESGVELDITGTF